MRKRLLYCIVFLSALLFGINTLYAQKYSGGDGSSGNPYQIATTADLIELSNTSDDWESHFIQTANITFNADEQQVDWDWDGTADWDTEDQKGFSPIGNYDSRFKGSYDGGGYTISNLYINRPTSDDIGLFGYVQAGSIRNLGIISADVTGQNEVGVLAGGCYWWSGDNPVNIDNCYSKGTVNGNNQVGGLIGYTFSGDISISKCFSSVSVSGNESVGGLVGQLTGAIIENCYATGQVDGNKYVGGLVGSLWHNSSDIRNSYSTGAVSGTSNVGGLLGAKNTGSSYLSCYWDTQTSGQPNSAGGTGKTTTQMKKQSTFSGWDFTPTPHDWNIQSGEWKSYPYLQAITYDAIGTTPEVNPIPGLEEKTPVTFFVKHDASGDNDGTSWTNAYTSFQSALNAAESGDLIWVAAGTYKPSSAYNLTNTSRYYHFRMIEGVKIYGGFAGTENPATFDLADRDFVTNETILSGDIGTQGDNSDNCYHVFYLPSGLGLTSAAVLDGFTITGGNASVSPKIGGGMYINNNSPTIQNIIIRNNNAGDYGGGLYLTQSFLVGNNLLIYGNDALTGGGIYVYDAVSSTTFNNITLANNTAWNGGGAWLEKSDATFNNSIIWGNTVGGYGNQLVAIDGTATLNHCCYSNSDNDIKTKYGGGGTIIATNDNTIYNPKFKDPDNNDFRLVGNSPCVDAGDDSYNPLTKDIRGINFGRKLDKTTGGAGTIDMGAYEYKQGTDTEKSDMVIYVNANASGRKSGYSWTNAFTSFQSALLMARSDDEIWVAKGTYKPSYDYDLGQGDRGKHFRMIDGVEIYGGLHGDEDPTTYDLADRDFVTNETILSGNIGNQGVNSDNCYHVFYNPNGIGLTSSALLDGFTITGGNADGLNPHNLGGGIYNNTNSPSFKNCTIKNNEAEDGGGIYNYTSSPTLTNCNIYKNSALSFGGGIFNSSSSSPILTNCTISDNSTSSSGGGLCNEGLSSPTLNNSIIWGNTAATSGNQIYIFNGTTTLNYSCYSNGTGDIYNGGTFTPDGNCIDSDPKLLNPYVGDYRLVGTSPCADAGLDSYCSTPTDIRGKDFDRKLNKDNGNPGTIDMGAYEYKFGTDPNPLNIPAITTVDISNITNNSAESGGKDIIIDAGVDVTAKGLVWSTTANPNFSTNEAGSTTVGGTSASFTSNLTGLSSNATYYVRAYNSNTFGTFYGEEKSFTTLASIPGSPLLSDVQTTSIDVELDENGNSAETEYVIKVDYNPTKYLQANGTLGDDEVWQTAALWGTKTVTGLTANTSYTFSAKARNSASVETEYGPESSSYTIVNPPGSASISYPPYQDALVFSFDYNDNPSNTEYAIYISWNPEYFLQVDGSHGVTAFWQTAANWGSSITATGLNPQTFYTIKVKARNVVGTETNYGDESSSWTLSTISETNSSSFTVKSYNRNPAKIVLGFQKFEDINNCDGYLLIMNECLPVSSYPDVAIQYLVNDLLDNGEEVIAVITNNQTTEFEVNGIDNDKNYYFMLVPFNWDGTNIETYNYLQENIKTTAGNTNGLDMYANLDYVYVFPFTEDITKANAEIIINNSANPFFWIANNASYTVESSRILIKPGFRAFAGSKFLAKAWECGSIHPRISIEEEINQPIKGYAVKDINDDFIIYPNPNDGSFTLLFKNDIDGDYSVEIYNVLSERVFKTDNLISKQFNISLDNIASGMYFVKVRLNNSIVLINKFIVR